MVYPEYQRDFLSGRKTGTRVFNLRVGGLRHASYCFVTAFLSARLSDLPNDLIAVPPRGN